MSNIENEENTFGPFEDLESQQYKKLYTGYDVPLIDIRKKYFNAFLIAGVIIVLIIVVLSITLKIPNYLNIPIEIENLEKDNVKIFNHSVKIDKFFAQVGDTIRAEQEICKISAPEVQLLISEIESSRSKLMTLKNFDTLDVALRVKNIDTEIENKQRLLEALALERNAINQWFSSKKTALNSEVDYFKKFEEANKKLYEKGVISMFDYMEIKQKYINKKEELTSLYKEFDQKRQQLNFKVKEINGEIIEFDNRQDEFLSSFQNESSKFTEQIDLALKKLKLFYGNFKIEDQGLVLLASKTGILTFTNPNNNLLEEGEMLYRLESEKGNFEGKGFIGADKIGYLRSRLPAKIMLETFPNYEWGNLTGIVNNISKSPNELGDYSFNIKITEENSKITPLLQNGQTGRSFILIEEKTLFGYLRRSINKSVDDLINR